MGFSFIGCILFFYQQEFYSKKGFSQNHPSLFINFSTSCSKVFWYGEFL
jgi:hypothetical protein